MEKFSCSVNPELWVKSFQRLENRARTENPLIDEKELSWQARIKFMETVYGPDVRAIGKETSGQKFIRGQTYHLREGELYGLYEGREVPFREWVEKAKTPQEKAILISARRTILESSDAQVIFPVYHKEGEKEKIHFLSRWKRNGDQIETEMINLGEDKTLGEARQIIDKMNEKISPFVRHDLARERLILPILNWQNRLEWLGKPVELFLAIKVRQNFLVHQSSVSLIESKPKNIILQPTTSFKEVPLEKSSFELAQPSLVVVPKGGIIPKEPQPVEVSFVLPETRTNEPILETLKKPVWSVKEKQISVLEPMLKKPETSALTVVPQEEVLALKSEPKAEVNEEVVTLPLIELPQINIFIETEVVPKIPPPPTDSSEKIISPMFRDENLGEQHEPEEENSIQEIAPVEELEARNQTPQVGNEVVYEEKDAPEQIVKKDEAETEEEIIEEEVTNSVIALRVKKLVFRKADVFQRPEEQRVTGDLHIGKLVWAIDYYKGEKNPSILEFELPKDQNQRGHALLHFLQKLVKEKFGDDFLWTRQTKVMQADEPEENLTELEESLEIAEEIEYYFSLIKERTYAQVFAFAN